MKRRIRTIFWLMTLCIVGVNGFQAYWLYTTWQLTTSQFGRSVREALAAVLQQQQLTAARRLFEQHPGGKPRIIVRHFDSDDASDAGTAPTDPDQLLLLATTTDSGPAPGRGAGRLRVTTDRRLTITTTARGPRGKGGQADSLANSISRLLINDWTAAAHPDLRRLAAAYHAELRARGTDGPFLLDTVTAGDRTGGGRARAEGGVFQIPAAPLPPGYAFQTAPVPLNPVRGLYVRAAFPAPTFYVLRRMGGLLAGSVLLLGLTTGCFLLMLTTILRQKKLADVKNDFINNMTHELKTPLATVSAAVEALQHFGALHDPARTQAYLAISRQELLRLSDLVEKVLQMATEEHRELALHPEPVGVADLVHELISRHQLRAPKPVTFAVDVPPTETVRVDPVHMGNVINNLIDNAIKYSGERVRIGIRSHRDAAGWHLTVTDDGLGIARAYQPAIFDRFFRVPTGNLHPVKGFGLGLYYVRQVVERHGGRITVQSEPGRGAAFSVVVPGC